MPVIHQATVQGWEPTGGQAAEPFGKGPTLSKDNVKAPCNLQMLSKPMQRWPR